jgi:predicted NBD/HSP70 family sugar kinase
LIEAYESMEFAVNSAYVHLASSEIARDINRDIILELIRSHQPVARADLSRLSGLQPSTVSSIVEQLIEERWITEGGLVRRPRGRRPTLLSLNDSLVMLAVDLRPRRAVVAVVDLNGRFLARQDVLLPSNPEPAISRIIDTMQDMRRRHGNHTFEGIGISLPGRVDPETQSLVWAPNLNWVGFDIKGVIEQAMKLKAELNNAANASLLSELWFGRMDGVRNAALVSIAEGIGVAIFANGQIISGFHGLAGEFGHLPIDPVGPVCKCGQRGCWEVFASSSAALRIYGELAPASTPLSIQGLMQLVEEQDEHAIAAVSLQATHIGRGLRLITAALAPELILITGDLTGSWNTVGPIIERELKSSMLAGPPPRLIRITDVEVSRLRGAAAMALQRHSGFHSSAQSPYSGRTRIRVERPSEGTPAVLRRKARNLNLRPE